MQAVFHWSSSHWPCFIILDQCSAVGWKASPYNMQHHIASLFGAFWKKNQQIGIYKVYIQVFTKKNDDLFLRSNI